jgi:hypothetical protein
MIDGISEEEAIERLMSAGPDALLFSAIGGNQFNAFGMIQHTTPFDFVEPELPQAPLREDALKIPVAVLEQMFTGFIGGKDGTQLLRLRRAFGGRFFHLAPPPPKEDDAFVLRTADTYFRERNIAMARVNPAYLRLKLWLLQVRVTEAFCRENDIGMLRPPAEAKTTSGFLAPNYYGTDATHANALYGGLVLDMIDQIAHAPEEIVG